MHQEAITTLVKSLADCHVVHVLTLWQREETCDQLIEIHCTFENLNQVNERMSGCAPKCSLPTRTMSAHAHAHRRYSCQLKAQFRYCHRLLFFSLTRVSSLPWTPILLWASQLTSHRSHLNSWTESTNWLWVAKIKVVHRQIASSPNLLWPLLSRHQPPPTLSRRPPPSLVSVL